ncbi:MAG: ATP-binding protein [Thermodesulfobacteriota bacterium]|nr:ATP-binding protein [Thermodesulfobacteriota bacterium]
MNGFRTRDERKWTEFGGLRAVTLAPVLKKAAVGGEYIELRVQRSRAPASTTKGHYYLRVSDDCKPLVGDEIQRLLNERSAQPWETLTSLHVPRDQVDPAKLATLVQGIRDSERVKPSVKEKSDQELLDHYLLAEGSWLTHLGVLCVGRRVNRASLGTAPVVQFIKYDDRGQKVNKLVWDHHDLSPMEVVEAVWREVPDFRERYEVPDGLFRQHLPLYDEVVVRELLVNAVVHRPYTQRGDIFLNLHPDRLEVVNPGLLPLGVTPRNILHTTVRRNEQLARVFHDLKLMEREGSGFDKLYEVLLSQGRPVPELREGPDRVEITVRRRVLKPEVIDLIAKADQMFQLTQRERITLGLLAQHEALRAQELSRQLALEHIDRLPPWMGNLQNLGLVRHSGRTRATRYFVDPDVLRRLDFSGPTTLSRIEPHRLKALIVEDLERYPGSAIGDVHARIGLEINRRKIKRAIDVLLAEGGLDYKGEKRGRRYWVRA